MTRAVQWTGRLLVVASGVLWIGWFAWRLRTPPREVVALAEFVLEVAAVTVALVLSAALWNTPVQGPSARRRRDLRRAPFPETFAVAVGLDEAGSSRSVSIGDDDTGEVAWARQGLRTLQAARTRPSLHEVAWSMTAVEGMRRMLGVIVIVLVLFTGRSPFEAPPIRVVALVVASQALLTLGHYLLSDGLLHPGGRLRWSMASVGAGFGNGTSRTGLPIRWTATLATMVALNLAVSLRGLSDRWTHGLGAMPHDERVMAMVAAAWLVGWGFAALQRLPQPELGYYGATRRLEEVSTRRLALGATLAVAAIGMIAGVLPGGLPA